MTEEQIIELLEKRIASAEQSNRNMYSNMRLERETGTEYNGWYDTQFRHNNTIIGELRNILEEIQS